MTSYVSPGKLFTASSYLVTELGVLTDEAHGRIVNAAVAVIRGE